MDLNINIDAEAIQKHLVASLFVPSLSNEKEPQHKHRHVISRHVSQASSLVLV